MQSAGAIVRATAPLKPEIRLAEAVSSFKLSLTSKQKALFRTYESQYLKNGPTHDDVMRFTAEIDRSRKLGGRCLGPRFTSFLHGIQQFAALGDIIVGGSQYIIACGVWSAVRMSLLAVVKFSSYIENLSLLTMEIGRTAPRNQEIGLLYPKCLDLQTYLNEYFIVVVHLCIQMITFSQKSTFGKIATALNDQDLTSFRIQLNMWSNCIKDEMNLQLAKGIKSDSQESSRFKTLSTMFSKSAHKHNKLAEKLRILQLCCEHDYETTWKQTRKMGNTRLFAQANDYLEWREKALSETLIFTGILGCGKSVLMVNMVDDLNLFVKEKNATVAFFFCRYDLPESLRARTIIGALVHQILHTASPASLPDSLESTILDYKDMLGILKHTFPSKKPVYFLLDGLDMCKKSEREELVDILKDYQNCIPLLICISSRLDPNTGVASISGKFSPQRITPIPDNTPEIESFIQIELESCLESGSLAIGNANIILDIRDALRNGSQGMFLWVALQIKSLCSMHTDREIQDALRTLPSDLPGIYDQILKRLQKPGKHYQIRILEIMVACKRLLTADEMREALSVTPGDVDWDANKLLNNVRLTLAENCGCILIVDEEETTVRFPHPSVERFVLEGYEDYDGTRVTLGTAEETIADIIVTYASYGIFDTQVSTFRLPRVNVQATPANIIKATLPSTNKGVQDLALHLLRKGIRPNIDIANTLARHVQDNSKQLESSSLQFNSYIRSHGIAHVFSVFSPTSVMMKLTPALMRKHSIMMPCNSDERFDNNVTRRLAVDLSKEENSHYLSPFDHSWKRRFEHVMSVAYDGRLELSTSDFLRLAVVHGSVKWVRARLECDDVNVNQQASNTTTALYVAVKQNNYFIVNLLVKDSRTDVNLGSPPFCPLWQAIRNRSMPILEVLLRTGKLRVLSYQETLLRLEAARTMDEDIKAWVENAINTGWVAPVVRELEHDCNLRDDAWT